MKIAEIAEKIFPETTTPKTSQRKILPHVGKPEVKQNGQEYIFTWPQQGVGIGISALREINSGIECEITVESSVLGNQHWSRINLASISAREALSKKLL